MQLWQLDIMGGIYLADGRECKLVTGIDDHSRFVVIAQVVAHPTGRAVCEAFAAALSTYGVPAEVLTDNGRQFTGRFAKPMPAEVLFERICRENGITARLTKPRSPTTTGKIERLHRTLRRELLDEAGPFADEAAAQASISAWVEGYNHSRPHQSLSMATPFSVFRPAHPSVAPGLGPLQSSPPQPWSPGSSVPPPPQLPTEFRPPPGAANGHGEQQARAVELEMLVTAAGRVCLPGNQSVKLGGAYAGRTVTVWADDRSIHLSLDGQLIRTRPSRLSPVDLSTLVMKGGRPAGPPPGSAALPAGPLPPATVVELERTVARDGEIQLGGKRVLLDAQLAGQQVTLRLEGQLMHVVAAGLLAKTVPASIPPEARARLSGARTAASPSPLPPTQHPRAQRRVPTDGVIMVARQRLRVGASHAGKTVTVVIDDTCFRVLHGGIELCMHPRKTPGPVTRFKAHARRSDA